LHIRVIFIDQEKLSELPSAGIGDNNYQTDVYTSNFSHQIEANCYRILPIQAKISNCHCLDKDRKQHNKENMKTNLKRSKADLSIQVKD